MYRGADGLVTGSPGGKALHEWIVGHARTLRAVQAAREESRDVVMIWGAAHLAGIDALLSNAGFTRDDTRWLTAIPHRVPRCYPDVHDTHPQEPALDAS